MCDRIVRITLSWWPWIIVLFGRTNKEKNYEEPKDFISILFLTENGLIYYYLINFFIWTAIGQDLESLLAHRYMVNLWKPVWWCRRGMVGVTPAAEMFVSQLCQPLLQVFILNQVVMKFLYCLSSCAGSVYLKRVTPGWGFAISSAGPSNVNIVRGVCPSFYIGDASQVDQYWGGSLKEIREPYPDHTCL